MKRREPLRRTPFVSKPSKRSPEVDGPQCEAARRMCCCCCGKPPPSEPDHLRTVGAGGLDRANVTPLCPRCHDERHRLGVGQFELERAPFRLVAIEDGHPVGQGGYETLQEVAYAVERWAFPEAACGHGWDWDDRDDDGARVCVEPTCAARRA